MFEPYSAMAARKNNPLLKVDLDASNTEWGMHDSLLEQMTDVAIDPSDGAEHLMRGVAISVSDVQFSKSEQFVTYIDGRMQKETVYWDSGLQIYYWQSQRDNAWYFEDPYNDDVITKAGSYNKLLKKLERRQFWWLETDEDVSVTRNPDGSKGYTYKGLHDPIQITTLLAEEAKQEQIASEKPVPQWKAFALSGMTLLGYSMGFQGLVKSHVSVAEPNQSELATAETSMDAVQLPGANASSESKQSVDAGSACYLGYYSFNVLDYQHQAIVKTVQFFSTMATGVVSMIHPRLGREHSMLGFSSLLTLLTTVQLTDGYTMIEANKKSFLPEPKADLPDAETFTHVFDIPVLPDDLRLRIPNPVIYPNQAMLRWLPSSTTIVGNTPVTSHTPDSAIVTSLMPATPLDIPIVYLPGHVKLEQANYVQKTINPFQGQLAQLPLSKHLPMVDAQSRQTLALSSTPSRALNTLSDAIKIANHTAKIEWCIREVQEKAIAKNKKSAQEKDYTVQVLDNLVLALSKASELLRKMETLPNYAEEVGLHETTILADALAQVRGYLSTQIPDLGLDFLTHWKSTPAVGESFLSSISEAIGEVDSKTLGAIFGGSVGAAVLLLAIAPVATHMMLTRNSAADTSNAGSRVAAQGHTISDDQTSTHDSGGESSSKRLKRQSDDSVPLLQSTSPPSLSSQYEEIRYAAAIMPPSPCRAEARAALMARIEVLNEKIDLSEAIRAGGKTGNLEASIRETFKANAAGIRVKTNYLDGIQNKVNLESTKGAFSAGGHHSEPLALSKLITELIDKQHPIFVAQGPLNLQEKPKRNSDWQTFKNYFSLFKTGVDALFVYSERRACVDEGCSQGLWQICENKYTTGNYRFYYSVPTGDYVRALRIQFLEAFYLNSYITYLETENQKVSVGNTTSIEPGLEYGEEFLRLDMENLDYFITGDNKGIIIKNLLGQGQNHKMSQPSQNSLVSQELTLYNYIVQFFKNIQAIQKKRRDLFESDLILLAQKQSSSDSQQEKIGSIEQRAVACAELYESYTQSNRFNFLYNKIREYGRKNSTSTEKIDFPKEPEKKVKCFPQQGG